MTYTFICAVGAGAACDGGQHGPEPVSGDAALGSTSDGPGLDAPAPEGPAPDAGGDLSRAEPPTSPVGVGMHCEGPGGEMYPCASGLLCCKPCCDGRPAVCTVPVDNAAGVGVGKCPLPDLTVSAAALRDSVGFGPITLAPSSCEVREACVDLPGTRSTLHFDVTTPNVGTADLVLGSPLGEAATLGEGFVYSRCHQHYHFSGYALYQLLDGSGAEVLRGTKRAFCLEDFAPVGGFPLPRSAVPQYDCNNQGISAGWADSYLNGLSCQFMDTGGVPSGRYTLRVTVNPDRIFPELSYDNNTAEVVVDIPALTGAPTDACLGSVKGVNRECGWRTVTSSSCTPGARVSVGCGQECGLGRADGDPMLRVCAGEDPCPWPGLGNNDDCTPGAQVHGALVNFSCPASGRFTVLTGPSTSNEAAICDVEIH